MFVFFNIVMWKFNMTHVYIVHQIAHVGQSHASNSNVSFLKHRPFRESASELSVACSFM